MICEGTVLSAKTKEAAEVIGGFLLVQKESGFGVGENQLRITEGGNGHGVLCAGFEEGAFISVAGLYDPFGIQYTVLQQVFRQMYGMTVYEYRTQVRMQEAKNLLLAGSLTVTEIAGRCGYTNASKFAAGFRRIAGMPPGEWRRRMKH